MRVVRVFALRGAGFCSAWCGFLLCVVRVFALRGVDFCSAWCGFLLCVVWVFALRGVFFFALYSVGVCFDLGGVLQCFRYLCVHSDEVVDNVPTYNIEYVLRAAYQTINGCIDRERSRMNFGGVQNIRFKLIVDEPV